MAGEGNSWCCVLEHHGIVGIQEVIWDCVERHYCDAMVLLKKFNRPLPYTSVGRYLGGFWPPEADINIQTESRQLGRAFKITAFGYGFVMKRVLMHIKDITEQSFCYMLTAFFGFALFRVQLNIGNILFKNFARFWEGIHTFLPHYNTIAKCSYQVLYMITPGHEHVHGFE